MTEQRVSQPRDPPFTFLRLFDEPPSPSRPLTVSLFRLRPSFPPASIFVDLAFGIYRRLPPITSPLFFPSLLPPRPAPDPSRHRHRPSVDSFREIQRDYPHRSKTFSLRLLPPLRTAAAVAAARGESSFRTPGGFFRAARAPPILFLAAVFLLRGDRANSGISTFLRACSLARQHVRSLARAPDFTDRPRTS